MVEKSGARMMSLMISIAAKRRPVASVLMLFR